MKRLVAALAAVAAFCALTGIATAAKPSGTEMTTTQVTSAFDGSQWVLLQAEKITQPGNAVWWVEWANVDGSACARKVGQKGTQTGATWGPTSYTFAYVSEPEASLQLGEQYLQVVGVTPATFVDDCAYGVLKSGQPGKTPVVLDAYVPLPWSAT